MSLERERTELHTSRLRFLYNTYSSLENLCKTIFGSLNVSDLINESSANGLIIKKSKQWKPKFAVLRENFLFFYPAQRDKRSDPQIYRLDDAFLKPISSEEAEATSDMRSYIFLQLEFPLHSKTPTLIIASDDLVGIQKWKDSLKVACNWWTRNSTMEKFNGRQSGDKISMRSSFEKFVPRSRAGSVGFL
ncbi:hypothetical protein ROZALSC1DRAFT_29436 [Rozella allomycis CSF55]|uniref:PH domain-containing protein n=1 Tax=Rozella allomycis (strain CSF55) TaxID=988480 RepID=A0A4P9YH79_ROZAC|nr:hypothetical protein ROZALSC1DRAFT_29436 [Rozella allomycis CSF55]